MKRIAIFASGKGSNAANICNYFRNHESISVALICSDRKQAGVFDVANINDVESVYLSKEILGQPSTLVSLLKSKEIDFIVLAGFLKLIPRELVENFRGKIINVHPALLPKFGGHGMFGMHVHEAVAAAQETETGITIHHVNEQYDEGDIIFQARTKIDQGDSPSRIAEKIAKLEMEFFPKVIEDLLK
jgi:phosphoribosylglycinamide formyltransferase-1